jgi:hypothetical protein
MMMPAQFLQMLAAQALPPLAALAIISAAVYCTRNSVARSMLDFWFSAAFSVALTPVLWFAMATKSVSVELSSIWLAFR